MTQKHNCRQKNTQEAEKRRTTLTIKQQKIVLQELHSNLIKNFEFSASIFDKSRPNDDRLWGTKFYITFEDRVGFVCNNLVSI